MLRIPLSPPVDPFTYGEDPVTDTAANFLKAQAEALEIISQSFKDESKIYSDFKNSLRLMLQSITAGGKIVFSGMGKSYKIGSKLVATLHSFGINSTLLHPSDALHGDVGIVKPQDAVVMISASGNSPELKLLLDHLPSGTVTILLTCQYNATLTSLCTGLLVAPLLPNHKEEYLYGLAAPTVSTTLCLVLGDAVCLALYENLEQNQKRRSDDFAKWHPGGAIGISNGFGAQKTQIPWYSVPKFTCDITSCSEVDLWKALATCPVVFANTTIYKSQEIIIALQTGTGLDLLTGIDINDFTNNATNGLQICRTNFEVTSILMSLN